MRMFGDGNLMIFQPRITFASNIQTTFYLDGYAHSSGSTVNLWPGAGRYTVTASDTPGYTWTKFRYEYTYDPGWWEIYYKPVTIGFEYSGTFSANYVESYIDILSSTGGYSVPGADHYTGSGSMQITAYENQGYHFVKWLLNGNDLSNNPTIYVDYGLNTVQPVFAEDPPPPPPSHTVYEYVYVNEGLVGDWSYTVDGDTYQTFTPPDGGGYTLYAWVINGQWGGNLENVWCPTGEDTEIQWFFQ